MYSACAKQTLHNGFATMHKFFAKLSIFCFWRKSFSLHHRTYFFKLTYIIILVNIIILGSAVDHSASKSAAGRSGCSVLAAPGVY